MAVVSEKQSIPHEKGKHCYANFTGGELRHRETSPRAHEKFATEQGIEAGSLIQMLAPEPRYPSLRLLFMLPIA